jgi:hypothetical protein
MPLKHFPINSIRFVHMAHLLRSWKSLEIALIGQFSNTLPWIKFQDTRKSPTKNRKGNSEVENDEGSCIQVEILHIFINLS